MNTQHLDEILRELTEGINDIKTKIAVIQTQLENFSNTYSEKYSDLAERLKACEDDIEKLNEKISSRDRFWLTGIVMSLLAAGLAFISDRL